MQVNERALGKVLTSLRQAHGFNQFVQASAASLGTLFQAPRAVFSLRGGYGAPSNQTSHFINWPSWCARHYQRHVRPYDPIRHWLESRQAANDPVTRLSDLVPTRELLHAPYYEDMLRPSGTQHVMTLALHDADGHVTGALSLARNAEDRDFSTAEQAMARLIVPVMEMAHAINQTEHRLVGAQSTAAALPQLTRREYEIAEFAAHGLSNKEIARRLNLSPWTVKNHLRAIFDKTGLENRTALCAWMMQR
ncbi:LuxR C-terminal-related transcriptional regulator [Ferrovibrio sp.]|uniref:helix-turn-helix transcriptional regulator n=1 Tax=Ferrovibrio sp. TaxID=1917215 RepID=UPI0035AD8A0A